MDTVVTSVVCLQYGDIRIVVASSVHPLGVEMCNRAVKHKETMFSDLSIAIQY